MQESRPEQARKAINGTRLDVLTNTKGTTFKHVVINNLTPTGLGIVHDRGTASVPLSELSSEWPKKAPTIRGKAQVFLDEEASKEKDYRKAEAAAPKKTDLDLIAEKKQKVHALVEKYSDLKNQTQVELTKAYSKHDSYTRYSANRNTADKQLLKIEAQSSEYMLQGTTQREGGGPL